MRYVYILRCSDDTLYTGITNDLEKRLSDHNASKIGAKYTKSRRPVSIIRSEELEDKILAMKREWRIKRMTRPQKEEVIQGMRKPIIKE